MGVSICVPTCNRPELLKLCLESCVSQSLPAQEILAGDDSRHEDSRAVVEAMQRLSPCPVRYLRHDPPVGQAANVDHLFREARGELLCLIHDDDLLLADSLRLLTPSFTNPHVVVAFGKHVIINHDGSENQSATRDVNRCYRRTPELAGIQRDLLLSALVQQFPNNGFVIRTELAQEVGYVKAGELMGDACDHAFGILCAQARPQGHACFVDEFTTCYRMTQVSVSRGNHLADNAFRTFRYLAELDASPHHRQAIDQWLRDRAPVAIGQAINLGQRRHAWSWYFSRWHRPHIMTPGGVKRLMQLMVPGW